MKRLPYKKRSRKKGPVQSKKVSYDGINFASGLERYMYMALRKAKIKSKYEGETFVLLNGFHFENEVYERQANGKGDYKNRGCKRILPIKYTPDFIGEDFIIETKGRANESFPMRWKLFKQLIVRQFPNDHIIQTTKSKRMRRDSKHNPFEAKRIARQKYAERQIEKFVKWSWEIRGKVKYNELVELQDEYKIKVYG